MKLDTLKKQGLIRLGVGTNVINATFPFGLGQCGVHEVTEARFGDMAAVTGFALAASARIKGPILWVSQRRTLMEHGMTPEAAFGRFHGGATSRLLVCPQRPALALWAIEEALRSKAVTLVIAEVEMANFTATRRLTLASKTHGVPVILLMPHTREGSTAAEARWRISARRSGPNKYDPRAPGKTRWRAVLERSRSAASMCGRALELEYDDETLSLTLAPKLATGPAVARPMRPNPFHRSTAANG